MNDGTRIVIELTKAAGKHMRSIRTWHKRSRDTKVLLRGPLPKGPHLYFATAKRDRTDQK